MVGTRSKARKASTPLSSPPSSPVSSPQSSSQSSPTPERAASPPASSRADTPYESSDSDDGFDSDHDSNSDHEEHCNRHTSLQATHCNALTYARRKCSRRGRIFKEGFFPVCGSHGWHQKEAGRCQATEKCGHVCNRLAAYTPPYFLCAKHEGGTNTLPCYITRLPTELRLMIFRYLFPDVIEATYFDRRQGAVLRVNRQFYEEASVIVYGECKFKAVIYPAIIHLFGIKWICGSPDFVQTLCQGGAHRIRHLEVEVNFGDIQGKIKGIGGSGISNEEYGLYQARDTVRKLVELLSPKSVEPKSVSLKQLKVKPAPSCKQQWRSDEAVAATFFVLAPFLALRPIEDVALIAASRATPYSWRYSSFSAIIGELHKDEEYRQLRKKWLRLMKGSKSPVNVVRKPCETTDATAAAYSKIEDFARTIYNQDSAQFVGKSLHTSDCPCRFSVTSEYFFPD